MVDIQGPGSRFPHDPYEKIRVHKIEGDKQSKEEEKKKKFQKELKKSNILWASIVMIFKRFLTLITPSKEKEKKEAFISYYTKDLETLFDALEKLKREDYSQDTKYLSFVSQAWHQFLEDSIKFKKDRKIFEKVEIFIEMIGEYPLKEEHSLGYYLAEYAGSDWVPFPFMELLQTLHHEHKASPADSHLSLWTSHLKGLILEIKSEEEPE